TSTFWACTSPTKTTTKYTFVPRKSSSTTTCCSKRARLLLLVHSLTVFAHQKTSTRPKRSTRNSAAAPNVAKMVSLKVSATPCALKTHWASHTSSSTKSTTWNASHGATTCTSQVPWCVWTTSTRSPQTSHELPRTCR